MTPDINTDESLNHNHQILSAKIEYLFSNQTIGSIANLVNIAILAIVQWDMVNRWRLWGWITIMLCITFARTILGWLFFRHKQDQKALDKWGNLFIGGTFCSGLSWGMAGIFLFPAHSPVHQMFTAFTIGGMVAGASAAYSAMRRAYFAFSLPAMVPIIAYSFSFADKVHTAMGAMLLLFLFLMSGTCLRNHSISAASMRLTFKNKDLITYLSAAKKGVEEINRKLTTENTERLKIETELEKHQKELESIVAERTAELERRNRDLGMEVKERQRAQAALVESEARYRLLVESANVGIALIRDETVLFANRFAATISEYSEAEIQSTPFLQFIHPDDRQIAMNYHRKRLCGEPAPESYQIRLLTKAGEIRWLEVSAIRMAYDKATAILIFFRDISQQRHLETQLLQSEKMAAIGQLAAGVAHEINNPVGFVDSNLNTLNGYITDIRQMIAAYQDLCSVLQAHLSRGASVEPFAAKIDSIQALAQQIDLDYLLGDGPQLIDESLEGTDRIKTIVMDLKNFAHPGEQKGTLTDINQSIESTLNIVWNELKYHAVVVKEFDTLPEIVVHAQQINQVFMNLLVNAAQSIDGEGEIKIRTQADDSHIEIRISDTGSGIPQEHLTKIFDPFFTTKPVGKGTGLGLNVSYNIIQKHNGSIAVESEVGKGTTFTVRLPL